MRKLIVSLLLAALFVLAAANLASAAGGFDEYGYNDGARLFNGTGMSWCQAKGLSTAWCTNYLGASANDKLVMKWNEEWDRGNAEGWKNPPYLAWTTNHWNGRAGGSESTWDYKIIWVGKELATSTYWRPGGYAIWGQFEVILDQGNDPGGHYNFAKATPNGLGGGLY